MNVMAYCTAGINNKLIISFNPHL